MVPPIAALDLALLAPVLLYALAIGGAASLALRQVKREAGRLERLSKKGPPPFELTVIQPILWGDPGLAGVLEGGVREAPGGTRFLWLVDDDDPAGQAAADEARAALGEARGQDVQVLGCPTAAPGVNPKSHKLGLGLEHVRTPYVAVVDDDVVVGADHLRRGLRILGAKGATAGLYTGLPSYRSGGGVGSDLIAGFVNGSAARTYLPPLSVGPPASINGMFWMTAVETLRDLGGPRAIEGQLCDDLAIAELYRRAGIEVHQGCMRQVLRTEGLGPGGYVRRMHRWFVFALVLMGRASWGTRLWATGTSVLPALLLWSAFAAALASRQAAIALAVVLFLRHGLLGGLLHATRDPSLGQPHRAEVFPLSSVLGELLIPVHALHALLSPRVRWRSRRYRARRDGTFEDLTR